MNEFETNIGNTFQDLKDNKDFTDVVLVSAGDQQVLAHKVVLALGCRVGAERANQRG